MNENQISFYTSEAVRISLPCAIAISKIREIFQDNKSTRRVNGINFICMSLNKWKSDCFPFWSIKTIEKTILKLEKRKILFSFHSENSNRVKFYSLKNPNRGGNQSFKISTFGDGYLAYLKSKKWYNVRLRKFKQDGAICEKCGATENLHVHHLTYDRLFREEMEDLMVFCEKHHKQVEEFKRLGGIPKKGDVAILRKKTYEAMGMQQRG